ncbi:hypothetical protein RAG00_27355 [Klebsiella variicola subsp. variicola]|uniref:hypothetical protein n=1 Tax=Klebsiella TaxID=570 RepID=UPI00188E1825|nr:hypothetical protein [Klebsiella variicola]EMD1678252.1 hypothetical protein [Klebsiella variicola]MDE4643090.1 hypothetical protein [Klebsiella variicola]HBU6143678.1 hypothetical protein [Klebsiella variicola]
MLLFKLKSIMKSGILFLAVTTTGCSLMMNNFANSQTMNIQFNSRPDITIRCLKTGAKINGFFVDDSKLYKTNTILLTQTGLSNAITIAVNDNHNSTHLTVMFDHRDALLIEGWNKTISFCRRIIN